MESGRIPQIPNKPAKDGKLQEKNNLEVPYGGLSVTNNQIVHVNLMITNTKPVVSLKFGQLRIDTLVDTGASISLLSSRAVQRFGLRTERGSTCTLQMAGGQQSTTDVWVSLQLDWAGETRLIRAVVIDVPSREFDLILGRPDQQNVFGDVLFREDGSIRAIKGGQETDIPLKPLPLNGELATSWTQRGNPSYSPRSRKSK